MKLKVSALFRPDAYTHDFSLPPSKENPGGGLAKKAQQLARALPFVEFTSSIADLGEIVVLEPLWFTSKPPPEDNRPFIEVLEERAGLYAEHRGYKLLWTSDFDVFRWDAPIREQVFEATDVLCGNSPYMVDVLKAFAAHVTLLTDPFDIESVAPAPVKKPSIYSCSQVIAEKRVDEVAEIYSRLEAGQLLKGFVGSSDVWGIEDTPDPHTQALEQVLTDSTDWRIKSAAAYQVQAEASSNWGYISNAGMETFGYGLAEAMAGGAECFCSDHLAYADRPVNYFRSIEEAVSLITERFGSTDFTPVDASRQWVSEHCGLDVFRQQFWQIVGGAYGVESV